MGDALRTRPAFLAWALILAPALAWWFTVSVAGSDGGPAKFVFFFVVLPALLTVGGAIVSHRRVFEAVALAICSAVIGGLTWFLTLLYLASQGVFD